MANLLLIFALEDGEIFLVQPGHQTIHRIGNGDWNQHQIHIHFYGLGVSLEGRVDDLVFRNLRRFGSGSNMHVFDVGYLRRADSAGGQHEEREQKADDGGASQTHKGECPGTTGVRSGGPVFRGAAREPAHAIAGHKHLTELFVA